MFDPAQPAKSIFDLMDYLTRHDDAGHFLYRGQAREYPGPLLPSLYRKYDPTGRTYGAHDPEYEHSLRKSGRCFAGLNPLSGWFSTPTAQRLYASSEPITSPLRQAFRMLPDPQCDAAAVSGRMCEFLSGRLSIDEQPNLELLAGFLQEIADAHHRRYIRDVVFSLPLGILLGTSVAQQYGFSSGYLDVTTSIPVAAFFATHRAKVYRPIAESDAPGIIYRFPRNGKTHWSKHTAMSTRYESFPESIVIEEIVAAFERTDHDYSEALRRYTQYALDAIETGDPLWDEYFSLPKSWLKYSRFGRQGAAVLVPDRIVKPRIENPEPMAFRHSDLIVAELFAVEDLSSRPGIDKYYFAHSSSAAAELGLHREELWPRDADFFLMVTKSLLMLGADVGTLYPSTGYFLSRIPNRPDLVDSGYMEDEIAQKLPDPRRLYE